MSEHWPRREDLSSCYGRGRSAARELASTGDVLSATLSRLIPCGTSSMVSPEVGGKVRRQGGAKVSAKVGMPHLPSRE